MSDHKRTLRQSLWAVFRRELLSTLTTPIAYVVVAVFLFAAGLFTFEVGRFFEQGRADLSSLFVFLPWIFMVFLPALAMRLWSEEIRSGGLELLMTLPVPTWILALGKFLACWVIACAALVLTMPLWVTVNVLGQPDNAAIAVGYLMAMLMAGAYLAIGAAVSALTNAQVVAFVLAVLGCFVVTALGAPAVLEFVRSLFGAGVAEAVARFSVLHHYDAAQRGVIEVRSLVYFAGLIGLLLTVTVLTIDSRRGG